jgi:shikimate dehydrogenase
MGRVGLRGACVPFQVAPEDLGAAVSSLRILNLAGAAVTAPFKEKVLAHLDVLSEGANLIGAVNTVVRQERILKGYNTNAIGIMETLDQEGFDPSGQRALVFGSGAAARAVVFILTWKRAAEVVVAGRQRDAAARLAGAVGGLAAGMDEIDAVGRRADIVINATSVSCPQDGPDLARRIETLPLDNCRLILDLNRDRPASFWHAAADRLGCPFVDGRSTLAFQARRTFFLWTGIEVPVAEFLAALEP